MGSLVPFQDLNLYPEHTTSTSIATSATPIIPIVKKEPKLEPLDEPFETDLYPRGFFPNPNPNFILNRQNQNQSQTPSQAYPQSQPPSSDSNSNSALNSISGGNALEEARQDLASDEANVYSEFYRVSELFRTAFGSKFGDVDVLDPDSRAIVPVPDESQLSNVVLSVPRKYHHRSSELVRVTNLGIDDERYFREAFRRTRMTYDSLRVLSIYEDEKLRNLMQGKRARGDLKAASLMRDHGLWLNRDKRIVGSIPGVYVGDSFFFRMELCVVGLHGLTQAGIDYVPASQSSNGEPIATSIIVSGGYEDDEDTGDTIIYTGHGGQDKHSRQCMHQKLESGNLALERSMHYGVEVRVIRGFKYEGSPSAKVYVYDGLYRIVDTWFDVGKSGFGVYKFKLIRMENQPELGSSLLRLAENLRIRPLEARPVGYVSLDISNRKETMPVFLFNDIDNDHDPKYYDYLPSTVFPPFAYNLGGNTTGCDCVGGCLDDCFCAIKNGGEFAYDQNGILLRGKPLVFECGPHCRCPLTCRNRVSQKGVKNRLEVFRSRETGWGVRSLDLIQPGSFICEYAGVVLTREQAQIFTMNGDSLVYPNRFAERWAEWGDLSQIFSNYTRPAYPSIPPLDFAMDVSRMRNVACYMSHSSSPNVLVQFVLYDHSNVAFPHLMLFALENIPPLRELSLDYGVADEWIGKAICN